MKQVTIYGSSTCGYCALAKRLLGQKGVKPVEFDIDADEALRFEMLRRTGRRTVPQIFIGDHHVGGFDDLAAIEREGKLDAML